MSRLLIPVLLALCLLGTSHSLFLSIHNGLFAYLAHPSAFFTIGPQPFPAALLAWPLPVNRLLTDLVAFFTVFAQAPRRPEQALAQVHVMTQFYGVWQVVQLEGLRRGNRGRLVGRTILFGLLFQVFSITFILPLYLTTHLLTRPRPYPRTHLSIPPAAQRACIPAGLAAFAVPAALIFPPRSLLPAPAFHYANALWQVFPATQHAVLQPVCAAAVCSSTPLRRAHSPVYAHVVAVTAVVHVAVLLVPALNALSALPVPSSLQSIALRDIFRVYTWHTSPVLAVGEMTRAAPTLGRLALSFMLWDVYCAAAALVLWAVAEASTGRGARAWLKNAVRAAAWTVGGGPAAAAAVMLRERDLQHRA